MGIKLLTPEGKRYYKGYISDGVYGHIWHCFIMRHHFIPAGKLHGSMHRASWSPECSWFWKWKNSGESLLRAATEESTVKIIHEEFKLLCLILCGKPWALILVLELPLNSTVVLCTVTYLLIFSFWEWAPSSEDPTGSSMTLRPVASWKVRVTGMLPPSRVRSGSTLNTTVTVEKKVKMKKIN